MNGADFVTLVGPALASALEGKGFTALMPVQEAVLDPELAGRDLRISSQTGSGKTVAIGLAIRDVVEASTPGKNGLARPRALVVVPTRELAKQVDDELRWLYAPMKAKVASATGGADYRQERRSFAEGPAIVVGTPGRLLDHLNRGSIDPSGLGAVVLDEADRMLDLGFREDLEAILAHAPPGHRTHLVSATFPREVREMADRVQNDPARIEGTPLGTANADIDHLIHLVAQHDRLGAIVNLLLSTPEGQTLVFVRTRADVADLSRALGEAGFTVRGLSGEMEQRERDQALKAFKGGGLDALVATDVAARGIDVNDIERVIHADPPTDPDTYTHRSGRTGRAGRKGTSSLLVPPAGLARVSHLLRRTGVTFRMAPIPSADDIRRTADERMLAELTEEKEGSEEPDARMLAIAEKLAESGDVVRILARLLAGSRLGGSAEPRDVRTIAIPSLDRGPRSREGVYPARDGERRPPTVRSTDTVWVPFKFTWGSEYGADPRRLLAMACRRGGVQASDVGAIQVGPRQSVVQISAAAAAAFATATSERDPRDPRVVITSLEGAPPPAGPRGRPAPEFRARPAPEHRARPAPEYRATKPAHREETLVKPDRPSRSGHAKREDDAPAVKPDRPSRAGATKRDHDAPAVKPDRPSRAGVTKRDHDAPAVKPDRPSRAAKREYVPPPKPDRTRHVPAARPSKPRVHSPAGHAPPKRKHDR